MLTVLLAFALLTSLNFTVMAQQPRYGGTIVVGGLSEPPTLNPIINWETGSTYVSGKIFDTLVDNDMELNPIPRLAESWDISEDELTYTFHLVQNATWHDGVEFTSADVKYTYELYPTVHSWGEKVWGEVIDSIETPDDNTVVFDLNKKFDMFRYMFVIGWILPKHLYEGTDFLTNEHNWEPIGTGPFIFKEWVKGSYVTLDANPNYWRTGKPYLDRVTFRFFTDASTLVLAFELGEVDHIPQAGFPISEVARFQADPDITIYMENTGHLALDTFFFNMRKPPFDNVLCRRAVAHCLNRTLIKDAALFGLIDTNQPSVIARVPALEPFWNPDILEYEFNITEANRLLDQAGYPRGTGGIRFTVGYLTWGLEEHVFKEAEILKSALAECGVTLEITRAPYGTWTDLTAKSPYPRDFHMAHLGYSTGPNPIFTLPVKYLSEYANSTLSYQNIAGYANPEVDQLWQQALDDPTNLDLFKQILYILSEDLPAASIASRDKVDIHYSNKFGGITVHPWSSLSYDSIWWREGELPAEPTGWEELLDTVSELEIAVENLNSQLSTTAYAAYGLSIVAIILAIVATYFARKPK